jgi:PAS domain S-box-containing protein
MSGLILDASNAQSASNVQALSGAIQKVLEEQRDRFPLLDPAYELIVICDVHGFIIYMNAVGRQMLGLEPDEDLSLFQIRCFTPLKQQRFDEIFATLKRDRLWIGENILQYRNEPIPVRMGITGHGIDYDGVNYFGVVARDRRSLEVVAAQMQQRSALTLEDYAEKLKPGDIMHLQQFSMDNAAIPAWWVEPTGKIFYVNKAACLDLGLDRDEIISQYVWQFDPTLTPATWEAHWQKLQQSQSLQFESFNRRMDGTVYPVEVTSNHICLQGREYNCQFIQNITERKIVQSELSDSNAKFRFLVENIRDITYAMDANCNFLYISPQFTTILGYPTQDWIGRSAMDLVHPDDVKVVEGAILALLRTGVSPEYEFRIKSKSGEWRWMTPSDSVNYDGTGKVIGFNGIIRDIDDRKRAEIAAQEQTSKLEEALTTLQQTQSRMVQSEKMSALGQLVAGVAHEINNPVNFIYGNLKYTSEYTQDLIRLVELYQAQFPQQNGAIEALAEEIDLDYLLADLPKMLSSMKVGADRIREIVLSLRNFSRLDESEFKTADLHEGIDSTLMILQNRIKVRDDRSEIEILKQYENLPLVSCYAGQLNQVFMNILANAIDALDEAVAVHGLTDPRITINTSQCDRDIIIAIQNNGPGIPAQIQAKLFDPFFTTKPVGQGTGMGLSISYQIITEKHHGTLVCQATENSTTFIVTLPLDQISPELQGEKG